MRDADFFAERVAKDEATGCWNWNKHVMKNGYGQYTDSNPRRHVTAHRGVWESVNGPIPDGMFVCHKCDNRRCCNPEHLFLGKAIDNVRDMHAKGRAFKAIGSKSGMAKLNETDVSIIKWCLDAGVQPKHLAGLYDATRQTIYTIRRGEVWTHVPAMEYRP